MSHFLVCQVLFVQRNLDELHSNVDTILKNAKIIEDKMKAHELMISVLTLKGASSEALGHAKSVLESLGFPFPSSINTETVSGVVQSIMSTVMTLAPDQLRSFPEMTEKVPLHAMKIMSAIHMHSSFSEPTMFQMVGESSSLLLSLCVCVCVCVCFFF